MRSGWSHAGNVCSASQITSVSPPGGEEAPRRRPRRTAAEMLAAHQRNVLRHRALIVAIRRYERYLPDFKHIARALRDQEHIFPKSQRSLGDLGLALSNTWRRRRYYESEEALRQWRIPQPGVGCKEKSPGCPARPPGL